MDGVYLCGEDGIRDILDEGVGLGGRGVNSFFWLSLMSDFDCYNYNGLFR